MNIGQFLVIFWARRVLIFWATVSCLVGALIVCALLPPRWESTARVMLNYIKPDPVTGQIIAGGSAGAYVNTQIQLVTDYTVAGKVAEQIGWFTDPNLIKAFQSRSSADQRDFPHWLADIVSANTKAKPLEGSNILEISYTANTAKGAKDVAGALLKAYMDATREQRQQDAERNAVWYEQQTAKAKQALDQAVAAVTTYEKENGIVLQDNKLDADSARLQALSVQSAAIGSPFVPTTDTSPTATQLAETDSELTVAEKTLGPNNPAMQELKAKRAALASAVDKERANMRAMADHAAASSAEALEHEVAAQKSRVIAQGDKIGRLSQLEQDLDLRREWYQRTNAKAAEFREESLSSDIGVTPLGTATTPKEPVFPNYWLIVPGAIIAGLAVGVLVSLLMELLGRRVRSVGDLDLAGDAPLICVIPGAGRPKRSRFAPAIPRLPRRRLTQRGAARA
jgi:succinoglycan biosynthesis transport protein ExoP